MVVIADIYDLHNAIKRISRDCAEAQKPSDFTYGVIQSLSPLKIKWDKIILDDDFLVITDTFKWKTKEHKFTDTRGDTITFPAQIKTGDSVVMIKARGGQKFLIVDKVVKK